MANLKFISTGSTTVTLSGNGLPNSFNYKKGSASSTAYTLGTAIQLANGEYVEFAGSTDDFSKDGSHYYQFSIDGTGTVEVEGDLISLINNNVYVKQYQFINLFKDCSKITSISSLNFPASIADFCYSNMFAGCTGLVNGGTTLPATTTTRWCYNGMFAYCSSMTTPPTILATKIAPFCYYQMFVGCSSLTNGPDLKNTIVEGRMNSNCMFKDCSSLSSIKVSFTTWPAESDQNQSKNWLNGVSNTGVLKYPVELQVVPTGVVPNNWTTETFVIPTITLTSTIPTFSFDATSETDIVSSLLNYAQYTGEFELNCQIEGELPAGITENNGVLTGVPSEFEGNISENFNVIYSAADVTSTLQTTMPLQIINATTDYSTMPFTISALQSTCVTFSSNNASNIKYNKNNGQTTGYCGSMINLNAGDTVSFEGPSGYSGKIATFSMGTGNISMYGNIASLIGYDRTIKDSNFNNMFNGKTYIKDVSNLYFNVDTVGYDSCHDMFKYCTFTTPPKFLATTYADQACWGIFANCTSLTAGCYFPVAISAGLNGFASAHDYCTAITQANYVLGNSNASYGSYTYNGHFYSCSNLLKAPIIADITNTSFYDCFRNCSKLSCIQVQFTSWSNNDYGRWLSGVSSSSNSLFIKPSGLALTRGASNIPTNWTVLNRHSDGTLWYVNSSNQETGQQYSGEDPYAWYYNQ